MCFFSLKLFTSVRRNYCSASLVFTSLSSLSSLSSLLLPGADPGFSVGGGANPPGGTNTKFTKKLHEIENILDRPGRRGNPPPPIRHWLPMSSLVTSSLSSLSFRLFIQCASKQHVLFYNVGRFKLRNSLEQI